MIALVNLRLTNGIDWQFVFKAAGGRDLAAAAKNAFAQYNREHASDILAFQGWFVATKAELDLWLAQKLAANPRDIPSLRGTYDHWLYEATRGRRYGRQEIKCVVRAQSLVLHVENPAIPGEWCNPTPDVASSPGGGCVPPRIDAELTIRSNKKYQSWDALHFRCCQMAEHAKALSSLGDWIAAGIEAEKTTPQLTLVKN